MCSWAAYRPTPVSYTHLPNDLYPKVMEIPLWTRGIELAGCSVELDPENRMKEITKTNNRIVLQGGAL